MCTPDWVVTYQNFQYSAIVTKITSAPQNFAPDDQTAESDSMGAQESLDVPSEASRS